MAAIRAYEHEFSRTFLQTLRQIPGVRIYDLDDPRLVEERVPTFAINLGKKHPRRISEMLAERNIFVWDGNYYALAVTERLGIEESGGMVRIGGAHYNTMDEIFRLGEVLEEISETA